MSDPVLPLTFFAADKDRIRLEDYSCRLSLTSLIRVLLKKLSGSDKAAAVSWLRPLTLTLSTKLCLLCYDWSKFI